MQVQQKCLTKLYLPFVRENCASLRPPSGEHPVRSVSSSSPPRTRLRWASRRFKRQNLCFLRLKCFPQCCFLSAILRSRPLLPCFTFVLSVQFSRCNLVRKNCAALHPSQAKGIRSASFLLPLKFKAKALNLVGAQKLVPSKLNNARNEKV